MTVRLASSVLTLAVACSACADNNPPSTCGDSDSDCETDSSTGEALDETEPNLAFVLAEPVELADGDAWTADYYCREAASAAGLPGDFRAWMSTEMWPAPTRLLGARGWVRLDGRPFADTAEDLAASNLFYPLVVDENGKDRAADDLKVITATLPGGEAGEVCDDAWTPARAAVGRASSSSDGWTMVLEEAECYDPFHLYCLGIDHAFEVAPEPQTGRRTFVSSDAFQGDVGVQTFDDACQADADAASLGGTFAAFVAVEGLSALDRFPAGEPWVNLRGRRLREDGALEKASPLDAGVSTFADGSSASVGIWTGAAGPEALTFSNCQDWSTIGGSVVSSVSGMVSSWFGGEEIVCTRAQHVLCFER